jgi:hypothetical protein
LTTMCPPATRAGTIRPPGLPRVRRAHNNKGLTEN